MRAALALIAVAALGCNRTAAPDPTTTTEPKPPSDAMVDAMHSNLALVASAHVAMIKGDVAGVKTAASGVASKPRIEGLPKQWMDYQVALRVRASEVSEVTDIPGAAESLSKVAKACGDCHGFVGVGAEFYAVPPPPPEGEDVKAHMAHHAWGADLMWKGLISADQALYDQGAKALGEASMDSGSTPDALGARGKEVHLAAAEGLAAGDSEARRQAYAKLAANCAGCHTDMGVEPTLPYTHTLKPRR